MPYVCNLHGRLRLGYGEEITSHDFRRHAISYAYIHTPCSTLDYNLSTTSRNHTVIKVRGVAT